MYHKTNFTKKEKIEIWLNLCEFSFNLMKSANSPRQLHQKIKKIRKEHLETDYKILHHLAKNDEKLVNYRYNDELRSLKIQK